jgi:hypothetical protein
VEKRPETVDDARRLAKDFPYVSSETTPTMPLTGNLLIDAVNQTGLGVERIDDLRRSHHTRQEVICHYLVELALVLGGGLDRSGKKSWIEQRLDEGQSFTQLSEAAAELLNSPAT